MARIKRRGLDYFPMSTDFIHDRIVRRIMKREGDGAMSILLSTLSYIYAGEGYYIHTDDLFYEDLSACLYEQNAQDVRRILRLAVEYGIFDAGLFSRYGILTSAEIQSQYLFSTKRRKSSVIEADYRLVEDAQGVESEEDNEKENAKDTSAPEDGNATIKPQNATSGTHSIAQHSIAQDSKENSLLNSSPETGGTQDADCGQSADGEKRGKTSVHKEWTIADIDRLQPPQDGVNRNFDGLKYNLRQAEVPLQEQYAIILKSNFGTIGHPMWRGFDALRTSHGKIHQPGRYLLSLCKNK